MTKERKARCTVVGEPDNAMKRRKALLSEEELLVTKQRDKRRKASKRASETCQQTLHRQEQIQTHMASMRASETFDLNRLYTGNSRIEYIKQNHIT